MNPTPLVIIIVATLAFESLMFGNELAGSAFPPLAPVNFGACGGTGNAFTDIACVLYQTFLVIGNVVLVFFGIVMFLWNLVSFNVPGTPWFVRLVIGSSFGGSILLIIAGLFRGTRV